ncbi:MAG TPA: hypothetical protein VNL77_25485 [Roseiflexaceae bacterium]|nr:hypothetical protein [Roseiflexaceae bacterium]
MGDDLSLDERNSVRTPMQWSDRPNAGFSKAPAEQLVRPVVRAGAFGYERVNVAAQRRDPDSLLRWIEHAIRVRTECEEIGWGAWQVLETAAPSMIAIRYDWQGGAVITIHNLAGAACMATIDLGEDGERRLVDLLDDAGGEVVVGGRHRLELEEYGFRWLRARGEG